LAQKFVEQTALRAGEQKDDRGSVHDRAALYLSAETQRRIGWTRWQVGGKARGGEHLVNDYMAAHQILATTEFIPSRQRKKTMRKPGTETKHIGSCEIHTKTKHRFVGSWFMRNPYENQASVCAKNRHDSKVNSEKKIARRRHHLSIMTSGQVRVHLA